MSTSIPLAVPAFIAIATAALPANFQVRFDTQFDTRIDPKALLVTGVRVTEDAAGELGPNYRHEEHYDIVCQLCSTAGNDDEATRMAEVYALYDLISVAIANAPTLNDTVRTAWTRQLGYSPTHDPKGFSVGCLDFEVSVTNRATSLS